jgi:hypothetical protein
MIRHTAVPATSFPFWISAGLISLSITSTAASQETLPNASTPDTPGAPASSPPPSAATERQPGSSEAAPQAAPVSPQSTSPRTTEPSWESRSPNAAPNTTLDGARSAETSETTEDIYKRRGFYLSLGFGCEVGASILCSATGGAFGPSLATKFQIGAAVTDKLVLHWTSRVAWVHYEAIDDDSEPDYELHPWGVGGAGVTYFLENSRRSPYVGADLGFSNIGDFERGENHFGVGFCGVIGYEFGAHWSVEHALCLGTAKDEPDPNGERPGVYRPAGSPFLATVTVNYLTL